MQGVARSFLLAALREMSDGNAPTEGARIVLDSLGVLRLEMGNSKDTNADELQIPNRMGNCAFSTAQLAGISTTEKDMENNLATELARCELEMAPYAPRRS